MTTGRPLRQGPIIGCFYLLAGVVIGAGAWLLGGWAAVPLWILAALLVLAGVWTALFAGLWLILAAAAERLSRRFGSSPE
jgi:CHASE2 domain-containing sensor protein